MIRVYGDVCSFQISKILGSAFQKYIGIYVYIKRGGYEGPKGTCRGYGLGCVLVVEAGKKTFFD